VVELPIGDDTSVLARPLAAEIAKPLSMTNANSHIICDGSAIDRKLVLNANRKPWALYRLLTSLPLSDVTGLVK
jgi:hypothetical protein